MEESNIPVSRREILKALAAGGGALAAAAFLPGRWAKPVVESGVLPAHAQSSCPYYGQITVNGACVSECPEGAELMVIFDWLPGVVPDSVTLLYGGVQAQVVSSSILAGHGEIYFNPGVGGTGFDGQLTLVWGNCYIVLEWNDVPPT